jgi:hypothetical protein
LVRLTEQQSAQQSVRLTAQQWGLQLVWPTDDQLVQLLVLRRVCQLVRLTAQQSAHKLVFLTAQQWGQQLVWPTDDQLVQLLVLRRVCQWGCSTALLWV